MFLANYVAPKTFPYNPIYLLIIAIFFFYGFVVALIILPPHNYKLAAIVATGGMFSKIFPLYLLWKRGSSHTALPKKTDVAIILAYFIFLWLQNTSVFDVYGELIEATYKAHTLADFIPILFGIVPVSKEFPQKNGGS